MTRGLSVTKNHVVDAEITCQQATKSAVPASHADQIAHCLPLVRRRQTGPSAVPVSGIYCTRARMMPDAYSAIMTMAMMMMRMAAAVSNS